MPQSPDATPPPLEPHTQPLGARRGQRLLFLTAVFGVLLNFPLLAVFDHDSRVAGVPVVYLYVLLLWGLLVALTAWLVRERIEEK